MVFQVYLGGQADPVPLLQLLELLFGFRRKLNAVASLGGSVSFPSPETGEMMTLKTIIARPGCVAYATSASGQVYTEGDEGYENMDAPNYYENYGRLVCHYYGVQPDGNRIL